LDQRCQQRRPIRLHLKLLPIRIDYRNLFRYAIKFVLMPAWFVEWQNVLTEPREHFGPVSLKGQQIFLTCRYTGDLLVWQLSRRSSCARREEGLRWGCLGPIEKPPVRAGAFHFISTHSTRNAILICCAPMADQSAAAKKAWITRKRRAAGKKAALTRKRRAAGHKAALTKKRRVAARKAVETRRKNQLTQ